MTEKQFLSPGDEFEVTIDRIGRFRDGLAKKDGFIFLVPNTNEGDKVKIRVTKCANRFGFAEVIT